MTTQKEAIPMTDNTPDFNQFVPNVHFEQIPIKNLFSNQDYQRNLSIKHVARAVEEFDLYQINPVKVSRRNGVNYVFNGQHTIEIVAAVSGSRETPVWCMIYDDLIYEKEADIFANQQKYVKPLLPYEIFMANIESGSEKHLRINDLIESYDLTVTPNLTPGGICAISTIVSIYDTYGYHTLDRVLRLAAGTWEGETHSFSANILKGIAKMINAYGDTLKDDNFKQKLGEISIKEISRIARERRSGSLGYAEAMVIFYNKRFKEGSNRLLPMNKLYLRRVTTMDETESEEIGFDDDNDVSENLINGQINFFDESENIE